MRRKGTQIILLILDEFHSNLEKQKKDFLKELDSISNRYNNFEQSQPPFIPPPHNPSIFNDKKIIINPMQQKKGEINFNKTNHVVINSNNNGNECIKVTTPIKNRPIATTVVVPESVFRFNKVNGRRRNDQEEGDLPDF